MKANTIHILIQIKSGCVNCIFLCFAFAHVILVIWRKTKYLRKLTVLLMKLIKAELHGDYFGRIFKEKDKLLVAKRG